MSDWHVKQSAPRCHELAVYAQLRGSRFKQRQVCALAERPTCGCGCGGCYSLCSCAIVKEEARQIGM